MTTRSYSVPVKAEVRGIVPVPIEKGAACADPDDCRCYGLAEEQFLNYVAGGISLVRAAGEDHKILEEGETEHETGLGEEVEDHLYAFPVDATYTTALTLEGDDITPEEAFGIAWDYFADKVRVGVDDATGTQEIASEMQNLVVGEPKETTEDRGSEGAQRGGRPAKGAKSGLMDPADPGGRPKLVDWSQIPLPGRG